PHAVVRAPDASTPPAPAQNAQSRGARGRGSAAPPSRRAGPPSPQRQSSPSSETGPSPDPTATLVTQSVEPKRADQRRCLQGRLEPHSPVQVRPEGEDLRRAGKIIARYPGHMVHMDV